MGTPLRVLLIEDSEDDALLMARELRNQGYDPGMERVDEAAGLRQALAAGPWDIVVSDWSLPGFGALAALSMVREHDPDLPFLIVSGTIGEETAVDALRAGAGDFLVKGRLARLGRVVGRELAEHALRLARRDAEEKLRNTEAQLLHSQKMEAVGRLAGGVAHDFNNVLAVILTYAELLAEKYETDRSLCRDLDEILAAAHHAADLTRQLLAFSRRQLLEPTPIDLNELLLRVQGMMKQALGAGITLAARPAERLWSIKADPGQLAQVVMNLVINARDAMPDGGTLTVATDNVTAPTPGSGGDLAPGEYVKLTVSDTGTGMDEATSARAFEPFFTTKERGKGTGLGLSTVYGIVHQSGGHVLLRTEPGQGTTFDIYFPRVTDVAAKYPPLPSSADDTGPGTETVLVVEDDDRVRAAACSILRQSGYTILEAPNAGEALLASDQHQARIDLLISDVVLPRMSGRELASRLLSVRPGLKVLFMSGYVDDDVLQKVRDDGAAFLQKPFTVGSLRRKVREVLGTSERKSLIPSA